jgi:aminoglycoside phosphotransferase (APT) family kinase protein
VSVPAEELLAWALRPAAPPGSNLKGSASGAGWLYALPRLHHDRVVCLGTPGPATLAGLVNAARTVLVVDPSPRERRRVEQLSVAHGWAAVEVAATGAGAGPVDLLLAAPGVHGRWLSEAWTDAAAQLRPDGIAVQLGRRQLGLPVDGRAVTAVRLLARGGEVRAVVPAADGGMRRAVGHLLGGALPGRTGVPGRLLTGRPDPAGPPLYLRRVADARGHDLTGWRWGVWARGDYDSQKVLLLLAGPDAADPTHLVKVTRSAAHAERLENEGRALRRLAAVASLAARVPGFWFDGTADGRAVLGQTLLPGRPLDRGARWYADDAGLTDALAWLTELARATCVPCRPAEVSAALSTLLQRYCAVYGAPADERDELAEAFAALNALPEPFPSVLQHGDPHPGNLLRDADGRTLFLDWESAEPRGLPLWDPLYLLRAFAAESARRHGERDRVRGAARRLLEPSPLSERLVAAVDDTLAATGLPRDAVRPLLLGCWVHRALKEATRRPADGLQSAPSRRLLREVLRRKGSPVLRRLTSGEVRW